GGQRPQRVLVRADTRSNSLILSGPQSKFAEVETLVRDLEKLGPAGGRISMVVPINNRNPQEIKDLIDQLVEESKNRTGGGKRSRRPASRSRRRR
ncbi:MAG: secretin N-terminal domain-containing protein, partial [Phycisphaerae bacterium]